MIIERRNHLRQVSQKINQDFAINCYREIKPESFNYAQFAALLVESAIVAFVVVGWLHGG